MVSAQNASLSVKNLSVKDIAQEPYMSEKMLAYFENKLLDWREKILREINQETSHVQEDVYESPADNVDRATVESERWGELSDINRQQLLLNEIDESLEKIREGKYGYCLETGEPIGIERLEAWPIAKLSATVQEEQEEQYQKLNPEHNTKL